MNMDVVACRTSPSRGSPSPEPVVGEKRNASQQPEDEDKTMYKKRLASALLGNDEGEKHKILKFTAKPAVPPPESFQSSLQARFSHNKISSIPTANARKLNRYVPSAPIKVLDAPELMNDYYLNLLSWGSNNILAVALGQCVYLWNAETGDIDELMTLEGDDYVSSVQWSDVTGSSHLAIGTSDSVVQLWDVAAMKQGIPSRCTVGFLSLFEAYDYIQVGSFLKCPQFNVWVVCSESHYSVFFAEPKLLMDESLERRQRLDVFYFDGLANQDEEIRLTLTMSESTTRNKPKPDELIPPLNLVLQTKWPRATIDWNGVEPLL
ncbi:hypothetical protein ATCC90586_001233 [Pythium insidiosum]|nr:hypothetical protein ATCC90586_001233 [Pythium insidiosum]